MGYQGDFERSQHMWTLISLFALITVFLIESSRAIMGGEDVDNVTFESLPLVGILHGPTEFESDLVVCSGVLLNAQTVLTAAHCVHDPVIYVVRSRDARKKTPRRRITSDQVIVNPRHNPSTKIYDFAIIKLEDEFKDSESIRFPVLTAPEKIDQYLLYGYGIDHWSSDGDLKMTVKSKSEVIPYESDVDLAHFIQFSQTNKIGICEGDSGGPAFVEHKGILHLIAIHTFATHLKGKPTCTYSGTSSYISIDLDWIKSYL